MVKNCKSRMSKDEAYSLIEEYFSSGELPSVFYRRVGIRDKQFYAWRQRYLRDQPSLSKKLGVYLTGKSPRNASSRLSTKDKPSVSDKVFARVEVSILCLPLHPQPPYPLIIVMFMSCVIPMVLCCACRFVFPHLHSWN